jgi:hypothetical protein
MLKSDDFPPRHLKTLVPQIDSWLGDMIRSGQLSMDRLMDSELPMTMDSFELGEQFLMVCLNEEEIHDVKSWDRDLADLVVLTGRRHHQLKNQKMAFGYARSLVTKEDALEADAAEQAAPEEDAPETLCQLFATQLAPKIQKAIEWLDAHEDKFGEGTWRVRLVTIPTFHTHAFLIQQLKNGSEVSTGESYILVISKPDWMETLPFHQLLRTREFLKAFEKKSPIIGVSGNRDVRERARF